ncbi:MAG: repressor LexA [Chloroflexi bacterium]|nr:repressor LexA [Chloroflexota bacterium]
MPALRKSSNTLSPKQQQMLEFIREFFDRNDRPPTIRDILYGCNISSTSVVDYNLNILERLGLINRSPEVSRGIELVERRRRAPAIPLLGTIAAGQPIPVPAADAWSTPAQELLELPADLTGGREGVYALRVKGLSMIDALIDDGDVVLMEPAQSVEDGQMAAVWLKDEKEVTLKRVYREKGRLRLQPANSQMKPIYTRPDNAEIQGKVVGVIRRVS